MSNRIMYDSTTLAPIPDDAEMVAYYPHAFPPGEELQRFIKGGKTALIRIDNHGANPTDTGVLDVESGAATVADCPLWMEKHNAAFGYSGTFYCNRSTLPALVKVMESVSPKTEYWLWIADPTGTEHLWKSGNEETDGRIIACQFAWPGKGYPNDEAHHYDTSLVIRDEWHPTPVPAVDKPQPEPAPEPSPEPPPVPETAGIVTFVADGKLAQVAVRSSDQKSWQRT